MGMGHVVATSKSSASLALCPAVQELAVNLMGSRFAHPAKWKFMAPYIQGLPDSTALYGKYTFIQEHVGLLQDERLVCPWPAMPQ